MDTLNPGQIGHLIRVQELLSQISRKTVQIETGPEKIKAIDAELANASQALADAESHCKALKKNYRDIEREAEENYLKEKKSKDKLNLAKTNKEYQATLKEIDDIRAKTSKTEDEMIQILESIEEAERRLAEKAESYREFEKDAGFKREKLRKETEKAESELRELLNDCEALERAMSPFLIDQFNKVKARIGSLVVVAVKNGVCQGCHLNIPPQMFNELQGCNRLMFCPFCQRILYWDKWSEQTRRSLDPNADLEESPNTEGQGAP